MSITQKNRFFNLPQEIQNLIYDFARDETDYKKFVKNYQLYYKLYKSIRKNTNDDYHIYLYFEEDNFFKCIMTDDRNKDKFKLNYEISNNQELEERTNDYINENIILINPNIEDYQRCLKDEYYIKNDFKKGMKKETIRLLKIALQHEKPNKIFNMLDLETFKHNYFRFNSINDLLNFNFIEDLDDEKILICYEH